MTHYIEYAAYGGVNTKKGKERWQEGKMTPPYRKKSHHPGRRKREKTHLLPGVRHPGYPQKIL